ncbi:DUF1580 domain-containing protein [Bythopirellula goksoeyrii]|uniref:Helix-turn-helix domain protein n=1 Tax=Bythopirellula goksoeyrii TaxID=1400387 RepID=A0A5B9QEC2_9BACT|nr:DUF1580 domain-containing protein [Bythopirellula goksoeyrii]QEG35256.1 hypothetical protein Pr1d_25510 [Bythopirellula goksoeyrii]
MNILQEKQLTLPQAAKQLGVNPSTVWRWTLSGVRGCKLQTISIGVKRYTSQEAIGRFVERTTAAAPGASSNLQSRSPAKRERDIQRAVKDLAKMGI